ncbi:MAG: SpvB/TcaC N-terminal domain-containing protein [Almyronema sp.]
MSKSGADSTAISPPAGTGRVAGMGEAFSLDLNSGQSNFSVPFELPAGVAGFKPTLKLEYTHGNGNGPFGLGWRLPHRCIERRLDFGVPGVGVSERFLDTDVELRQTADGSYRPIREMAFSHYQRRDDHWEIVEKDGKRAYFGLTAAARVSDPHQRDRIQTWLLEREEDVNGNRIDYDYATLDGYPYLVAIRYGKFVVRLSYEARPDPIINGRAGFVRRLSQRCHSLSLHLAADNRPIRTLALTYTQAPFNAVSLLTRLQLAAHGHGQPDGVKNPLTLSYSSFDANNLSIQWIETAPGTPAPPPLSDRETALLALDDLPLPGILANRNGRQYYWPNTGEGHWGLPRSLDQAPFAASFAADGVQFVDMDGSGSADMLVGVGSNPLNGYYENDGAAGFGSFRPYPTQARVLPPFESGRVRLYDIEGDGQVDAIYSAGRGLVSFYNQGRSGWTPPTLTANTPQVSFDDPLVFLADMTGDGLPDLVRVRSGRVEYWLNLGHGRFGDRVVMANSPRLAGIHRSPEQIKLFDVDGDGCSDLVRISAQGIELFINQSGQAFAAPQTYTTLPIPIPESVRPVDLQGRAATGLLYNSQRRGQSSYVYVHWDQSTPAYRLHRIDNGVGLVNDITYQPLVEMARQDHQAGRQWQTYMPFPLWVVSATRESDQVSGRVAETQYRYHEGHFDPLFRRFQGFRQVDRREIGDESRADILTKFTFLMNQAAVPGHSREHAHLDRLLTRVETFSLDGSPLAMQPERIEETEYDFQPLETLPDGTQRVFVFAQVTRKRYRDRTADERVEEMTYDYDTFGNVIRETKRGFGRENGQSVAEKVLITEIGYASDPQNRLFKPAHIIKRNAAQQRVRELHRLYDGLPLGQLSRGLQTREEVWVMAAADFDQHYRGMDTAALGYFHQVDLEGEAAVFALLKETTYTPEGNRATERTGGGRTHERVYDADHLYVISETVNGQTTQQRLEPIYGKPLEIRGHNGAVVRLAYDAFGRTTAYMIADDTPANPTRQISYDDRAIPNALSVSYRISPTERLETVSYRDGSGKELQKRVERQAGEVVVSGWLEQNPWGQTRREFEPTLSQTLAYAQPDTTTAASRRTFYDAAGRPIRSLDYNGGLSTASYTPFEIILADANDTDPNQPPTPRRERVDVWNHRTEVIEAGDIRTAFEVGLFGELLSLADANGIIARYQYDQRGNRLMIDHREAGQRQQWFDSHNDIVRTLDAAGHDVSVSRDREGRIRSVSHNHQIVEQFSYDDLAPGTDGRMQQAIYDSGQQTFSYDDRGRLIQHTYTIGTQQLPLSYEYNDMGKPIALTYPDGTRLERTYYRNGMTRRIEGVIDEVIYDARNLPTRIAFANGVVTEIAYEPGVGWIAHQRTVDRNGTALEDVHFSYDQLHRLVGLQDTAPGSSQAATYSYDARDQLQQVSGHDSNGNYSFHYAYENGYNLTHMGESDWQLHYAEPQRPDRLSAIARPSEPLFNVSYSSNGNLLTLPGRQFVYNFKNQLTQVSLEDGTVVRYEYDFRGQRTRREISRNGTTTETLFVGDLVERRAGQFANFVIFNQMQIALLWAGQQYWLHKDRLGSTRFFSDELGNKKIAQIAYHPFGKERQRQGVQVQQQFAAHPVDQQIGLVFMGRRWYSPEIGRFLTPDPLYLYQPERAKSDVKQLRLYTYVGNDPLNKVDPTGLSFWSVLGAIVGVVVGIVVAVAVAAAFATGIGFGILAIVGVIGLLTISYVAASANQDNNFGEFMRGFMIGFNAGMNATLLTFMGAGVLGVVIGVINFLAAFDTIANSEVYQGILGWSSWLMPMSWLATGIGLIFFVLNGLAALFTLNQVEAVRIESLSIDWGTGTIVTEGGFLFLPGFNGGYNLGNFAYVTPGSTVVDHETGHTLNVAAFGSIFHFIGAIDENVVQTNPADAYAERLAESNDPTTFDPDIIPMWV